MLVDSHCHLTDAAFDADREAALDRARAAGVGAVVVIGETPEAADRAIALALAHPAVTATAGLHPHEARRWSSELAGWLAATLSHPRVVAAGETGLDYHYDHSPKPEQRLAFEAQLEIAREAGKPAVIHAREADDDIAAILDNHRQVTAVMHSYSSGLGLLRRAVALGHYVSFSGMITFKSWRLDQAVLEVPLDRLLVETDAPYLAPVPFRGRRNEPAMVGEVARRLGAVVGKSLEEISAITTTNAAAVFGAAVAAAV
jgi:TatD DNase family protein